MVESNEFSVQIEGKPEKDMKRVETFFDEQIKICLKQMAENALLIE